MATLENRFFDNVSPEPNTGCWLWAAHLNAGGYGRIWADGRQQLAHRVSLALAGRPPADSLDVDHLCRTPSCVNPDHLEAVTHKVNMSRGHFALKTHCPHGHAYVGSNLRISPDGSRMCRACIRGRNASDSKRRHLAKVAAGLCAPKPCCKRGHAFYGSNLRITKEGHRHCRACRRDRMRMYRKRAKDDESC